MVATDGASSSTESVTQTTIADEPFNDPGADFVLITSDRVVFNVHKCLLSLFSPVFETMLSLPPTDSQERYGGVPGVAVAETAKKLRLLLSWCDPRCARDAKGKDLNDLQSVLELADKYSMGAIVVNVEETILGMEKVIASEPLRVFCIAARFRLQSVMHAAVLEALKVPVAEWTTIPEMEHIPAFKIVQLIQYHKTCVDEVQDLAKGELQYKDFYSFFPNRNNCCSQCSQKNLRAYLNHAAKALENRPSAATLDMAFLRRVLGLEECLPCSFCRTTVSMALFDVQQHLVNLIKDTINQVEMPFEF